MKKLVITLCLLSSLTLSSYAQACISCDGLNELVKSTIDMRKKGVSEKKAYEAIARLANIIKYNQSIKHPYSKLKKVVHDIYIDPEYTMLVGEEWPELCDIYP